MEYGGECHISGRPYTVFRWRPGNDARYVYEVGSKPSLLSQLVTACPDFLFSPCRYKKTIICQEVAKAKNVCQVSNHHNAGPGTAHAAAHTDRNR